MKTLNAEPYAQARFGSRLQKTESDWRLLYRNRARGGLLVALVFILSLAVNVFDSGRRRAETTQARAEYEQATADYRETVLSAFREVEDQLAALRILELGYAVRRRMSRRPDAEVVILTGTGDEWSGPRATPGQSTIARGITASDFDRVHWEGRALLMNLLAIEVPVIWNARGAGTMCGRSRQRTSKRSTSFSSASVLIAPKCRI